MAFAPSTEVMVPVNEPSSHDRPAPAQAGGHLDTLLAKVADGDEAAFGALFDEVGGNVFGTVRRVLRDPSQSEEVTQEVMLEVWRHAARFSERRGSAAGWILTIAHRRAIDRVRSEQAARDRADTYGTQDQAPAFDDAVEQVEQREEAVQVTSALDALTERQRQVVELAYYQGYTYRQVAELLDTPLGTVKTRMRDALIRLRGTMEVSR